MKKYKASKWIQLYTDGSCYPNPGPGAWACVFNKDGTRKHISGYANYTTNNRMEMLAVIKGLHHLNRPCFVSIYTDSKYVLEGFTRWFVNWERNNWKTKQGDDVKNQDLWERLKIEVVRHEEVTWTWVRGHSGVVLNELVDGFATEAAERGREKRKRRDGTQLLLPI